MSQSAETEARLQAALHENFELRQELIALRMKHGIDTLHGGGSMTAETGAIPMMDRPAYELVRLIQKYLDDADQFTDTPQRPNRIAVWGIRMLLEPYGGNAHRWQWPSCFECGHQSPLHAYGQCDLCGCALTQEEVIDGRRDEDLDDSIEQALRDDHA